MIKIKELEIWKFIPGYKGQYEVSSLGRVRSITRKVNSSRYGIIIRKGKISKLSIKSNGYKYKRITINKHGKNYNVSVLVAMAFLNYTPNGKHDIIVDHINNIKTDDRLINLQLITQRENCTKDKLYGTSKYIGVSWHKNLHKWRVNIRLNNNIYDLGYYIDEKYAANIYQNVLTNWYIFNTDIIGNTFFGNWIKDKYKFDIIITKHIKMKKITLGREIELNKDIYAYCIKDMYYADLIIILDEYKSLKGVDKVNFNTKFRETNGYYIDDIMLDGSIHTKVGTGVAGFLSANIDHEVIKPFKGEEFKTKKVIEKHKYHNDNKKSYKCFAGLDWKGKGFNCLIVHENYTSSWNCLTESVQNITNYLVVIKRKNHVKV